VTRGKLSLRLLVRIGLLVATFADASLAQNVPGPTHALINGMPNVEVLRRIFKGEQDTMRRLRIYRPIVETYIQSLWPDTSAQIPIDDLYFLSKLDISRHFFENDGLDRLFGKSEESGRIFVDNGQRQELYPTVFIRMLFIDPQDFDPDTYRLTYLQPATLGKLDCLVFEVVPVKNDAPHRFKGMVWVERTELRIVRVQGTFQVERVRLGQKLNPFRRSAAFSIRFDCWRQVIAAGLWAPAYVAIDDNIPWKAIGGDGTTDVHYRGYTFVWGYSHLGSFQNQHLQEDAADEDYDRVVAALQRDGLLGTPGNVEQSLNSIVEEIVRSSNLDLPPIRCRVLLTTPVELFHSGNTIIVSRGLLDIVPDKVTLAVLLTHELAHMFLETSASAPFEYTRSLFDYDGPEEFSGLVAARHSEDAENAAAMKTCELLKDSPYLAGMDGALAFALQLASQSSQVTNLTRARFGAGLVESGHSIHKLQSCFPSGQGTVQAPTLRLSGAYTVDAWTGKLRSVR